MVKCLLFPVRDLAYEHPGTQGRRDRRLSSVGNANDPNPNDSLIATYFLICLFSLEVQSMGEVGGSSYMKRWIISFLIQVEVCGNALMTCRS